MSGRGIEVRLGGEGPAGAGVFGPRAPFPRPHVVVQAPTCPGRMQLVAYSRAA